MRTQFSIALTVLLVAVACSKKPAEQTSAQPSAAAPAVTAEQAVAAADTAAVADDDDIDLPDDFTDQAAEEVTADNVEGQVAAIEKELQQP